MTPAATAIAAQQVNASPYPLANAWVWGSDMFGIAVVGPPIDRARELATAPTMTNPAAPPRFWATCASAVSGPISEVVAPAITERVKGMTASPTPNPTMVTAAAIAGK